MRSLDVRRFLGQRNLTRNQMREPTSLRAASYLNTSGAPGDESSHFALSNALQALVDLRRIHFALYDIENRDVAAFARGRRHHDVLCLQQTPHHVKHSGLAHRSRLDTERDHNNAGNAREALRISSRLARDVAKHHLSVDC